MYYSRSYVLKGHSEQRQRNTSWSRRSAAETSITVAYRLADTLVAHGATQALDMDAALQVSPHMAM